EPAHMFEGRVPKRFAADAPRVIVDDDGLEYWEFGSKRIANRTTAVSIVGRPRSEWIQEPVLFSEMRLGSYDPKARIADMDLCGIWASLAFPSTTFGFVGQQLQRLDDPELALACVRAYNDWVVEEWAGAGRERMIPQQLPWMDDPVVA